jgi:mannose-1-phosphate guanylyltransferase
MNKDAYAVIMAGGKGERFWPLSTSKHPKQVLSLFCGKPMLQMAVEYLDGLIPPDRIFVITSADLVEPTQRAAPSLPRGNIIGEPFGRDTAAVCALGSALVKSNNPEAVFCILTADHIIGNIPLFQATLRESIQIASSNDALVTIGIQPTFPSTGYGYIEADKDFPQPGKIKFRKAIRFVEKPHQQTAEQYLRTGRYFWNSGMFIWSVKSLQAALAKHSPQLLGMANRLQPAIGTSEFDGRLKEEYEKLEKISIDYALMEKSQNIVMARGTFGWDDVGSWVALRNHFKPDDVGNVVIGTCENIDAEGNVIVSNERLTALIGVKDLVVIQSENATLICTKDRAQDVKKMVQLLNKKGKYQNLL